MKSGSWRRRISIAAALLVAVLPVAAAGDRAAELVYADGDTSATGEQGATRVLAVGDPVYRGDTVVTQSGGARLQFTDGGEAALLPRTEYRVEDYHYTGDADGSERSFFQLLKGRVRFTAGAVSRAHPDHFRVVTGAAAISARGASGWVTICVAASCPGKADGTYVTGHTGVLLLTAGDFSGEVRVNTTYYCNSGTCKLIDADATRETAIPIPGADRGYGWPAHGATRGSGGFGSPGGSFE